MICLIRDYRAVTVITAESPAPTPTDAAPTPERAALAGAIDAQARRMDQLSAAIVRATSQVAWSGRAAERFRARAAERSRECLQLAVALRASAERVHAAAMAAAQAERHAAAGQPGQPGHPGQPGQDAGDESGHSQIIGTISGMAGGTMPGVASGTMPGVASGAGVGGTGGVGGARGSGGGSSSGRTDGASAGAASGAGTRGPAR